MYSYVPAFLLVLLSGYLFAGRGFSYLGVPPVFVGETGLLIGLTSAVLLRSFYRYFKTVTGALTLTFIIFGAVRTVPYLGVFGLDALRDAALWYYALFAPVTFALTLRCKAISSCVWTYTRITRWFVLWSPLALILKSLDVWPKWPTTGVPIVFPKAGDTGVHLAGVAAAQLLGIYRYYGGGAITEALLWLGISVGLLLINRAGMLAFLVGVVVVLAIRRGARWKKMALAAVLAAITIAIVGMFSQRVWGPLAIDGSNLYMKVISIFTPNVDASRYTSTRQWRIAWWQTIIGYTVFGDYFWGGKGFGLNLAMDDGFQVTADRSLRSPHNSHLTVLARMGVPGFVLWLALQTSYAGFLMYAYLHEWRRRQSIEARILLWLMAYWSAFMVNASFDVVLESPHSAIWFWCLFGYGMAVGKSVFSGRVEVPK